MHSCWRKAGDGRGVSQGRSTALGPPALPAVLKARVCVEVSILLRGDQSPESTS